jgi:uncharacterized protein
MKPMELYQMLKQMGIEFDVVEIGEGIRTLNIVVEEEDLDDEEANKC